MEGSKRKLVNHLPFVFMIGFLSYTIMQTFSSAITFEKNQVVAVVLVAINAILYLFKNGFASKVTLLLMVLQLIGVLNIFYRKTYVSFYIGRNDLQLSTIDFDFRILPLLLLQAFLMMKNNRK